MNNPQKIRRSALLLAACAALSASAARADSRIVQSFDSDWRFYKGDATGAEAVAFQDNAWTTLSVPHDWPIEGPFLQNAPTRGSGAFAPSGVVWYRKTFPTPANAAGKKVFIDFDGIMQNSDVYINGFNLGHRPYGYVSLQYELTSHLNTDGKPNILAVRADTSAQPASRWYNGGGIYRHVRLEVKDPVHIDNWGTFVTTPKVDKAAATVHVRSSVINQSAAPRDVSLQVTILGPDGKSVGTAETKPQSVPAGKTLDFDQDVTVNTPSIWDLENPALYTATAAVRADGQTIDDQTVPFGIRSFEFKADTGFWLNGQNFKIKGVCLHSDAGPLGIAVPEDEWIHRLSAIKQYGGNAVRTAHNPPSPEFLNAADKVGMLVMDEMFDCWDVAKNPQDYHLYFDQWNLIDTRDTVRRDRNHPSIVLYSAGNEIHDTPNPAKAIPILTKLVATFHENDPTRPVTQALFRPNSDGNGGSYNNGLSDLLDVVGTNYRDAELLAAWQKKPTIKLIGTEQGKTLQIWSQARDNPQHSGQFIWSGVDYLGEVGGFPNIAAGSGIFDLTNRPKNECLERASWWSTKPVVYLVRGGGGGGRGLLPGVDPGIPQLPTDPGGAGGGGGSPSAGADLPPDVTGPLFDIAAPGGAAPAGGRGGRGAGARGGAAGAAPGGAPGRGGVRPTYDWTPAALTPHSETVNVYSNCDEVELFLNDKSLGAKPRGARDSVRTWQVDFAAGTLRAVGKNKGEVVARNELTTAGAPAKIAFAPSTTKLFADFDSLSHVTVSITDANGNQVPTAANLVTFKVTGPGMLAAVANGSNTVQDFRAPQHAALNGQLAAYIRATGAGGPVTLTATADGLAPATLTFETAPARPGH
jgi:beta-galactosidase